VEKFPLLILRRGGASGASDGVVKIKREALPSVAKQLYQARSLFFVLLIRNLIKWRHMNEQITRFTRESVKLISDEIDKALDVIREAYGLKELYLESVNFMLDSTGDPEYGEFRCQVINCVHVVLYTASRIAYHAFAEATAYKPVSGIRY